MNNELLYNQLDKRTEGFRRSDFLKELQRLERVNKHLVSTHKELIKFIENEIEETDNRIEQGYDFLGKTNGSYTLERYLKYYKKALVKVSKKIDELERV